jgi:hypothetical protein
MKIFWRKSSELGVEQRIGWLKILPMRLGVGMTMSEDKNCNCGSSVFIQTCRSAISLLESLSNEANVLIMAECSMIGNHQKQLPNLGKRDFSCSRVTHCDTVNSLHIAWLVFLRLTAQFNLSIDF